MNADRYKELSSKADIGIIDSLELLLTNYSQLVTIFGTVFTGVTVAITIVFIQGRITAEKEKMFLINSLTLQVGFAMSDLMSIKRNYYQDMSENVIERLFQIRKMVLASKSYKLDEYFSKLSAYRAKGSFNLMSLAAPFENHNTIYRLYCERDSEVERFYKLNELSERNSASAQITLKELERFGLNDVLRLVQLNEFAMHLVDDTLIRYYNLTLEIPVCYPVKRRWLLWQGGVKRYKMNKDSYFKLLPPLKVAPDIELLAEICNVSMDIITPQFDYSKKEELKPYPEKIKSSWYMRCQDRFIAYSLAFLMLVHMRFKLIGCDSEKL